MTPTMMFFSFALSSSTNSDSVALLSENAKSFLCLKLTLSTIHDEADFVTYHVATCLKCVVFFLGPSHSK